MDEVAEDVVKLMKLSSRFACLSLLALACTNQKLVPVTAGEPPVVDDLVQIEAEFCTRPVQDVAFPVKLLLVVDGSGSMQFTDQPSLRVNAVRQLVSTLETQTNVAIATMGFGSNIYLEPAINSPDGPFFVPANQWNEPDFLQLKDVTTDYHGAWTGIQTHLLSDMLASDPAELARTKYVVVFFTDGSPDPRCCIDVDETVGALGPDVFGCAPDTWETPVPGRRYCENAPEPDLCNVEDMYDQFVDNVTQEVQNTLPDPNQTLPIPNYGDTDEDIVTALSELELNGNYNRTYQILAIVEDIMEQARQFGVGQIQINTALLFDDSLPDPVKEIYRLNKCRSTGLLTAIAEIGEGQFRDFEAAGEIDFLSFNFTSLKQGFTLISSYAHNQNALPPSGEDPDVIDFRADTDGDGLDDELEFELGTDPAVADSDKQIEPIAAGAVPVLLDPAAWGDGYNDALEQRLLAVGFDPRFQRRPIAECSRTPRLDNNDVFDLDADGLNGCEETILGTDPRAADTDADSLPDGIEQRVGLDPTTHEGNRDDDFDGTPNIEEVRKGLDPLLPDSDREETAVRYELVENGETEDGRTCFTSIARGVHLATTGPRFSGGRSGYNDVLFVVAEAPIDNPTGRVDLRVACARTQYVKPTFKDPARGELKLTETNDFCRSDGDCVGGGSDGSFCVGVADRDGDGQEEGHCSDFIDLSEARFIERLNNGEDLCVGLEVR